MGREAEGRAYARRARLNFPLSVDANHGERKEMQRFATRKT
jgi:hypothetical protein